KIEMFPRLICLILTLTDSFFSAVSSTGQSVVKLEGDSVTLDLQRPAETGIKRIIWSFNLNTDIVTYYSNYKLKTEDEFKDKVYFNSRTFSLLVKNLRKSDSGIYRAEGPGGWVLAEYRLRVLEPVEAPVLTLVTYWSTGDSCHVTVNCTGGDRSLMSSCDNTSCSPEGGASTDSTLSMSVRDDIISCNHSNPFSWKSQTIEINRQCFSDIGGKCILFLCFMDVFTCLPLQFIIHIREKQIIS
uniref:Immunoglobulin V-set domain-containing protein n=1 Tax=Denticeps clupeoides TaxID=299321 RepID=A0AAY4A532_9TELE